MKSHFNASWWLAVLMALPMLALAHDPKPATPAAPVVTVSDKAKPVVAVVEKFSAAMHAGDLDRAGALLADDVLILESGGAEHSRAEYVGGNDIQDAAVLKTAHRQVKQRAVRG